MSTSALLSVPNDSNPSPTGASRPRNRRSPGSATALGEAAAASTSTSLFPSAGSGISTPSRRVSPTSSRIGPGGNNTPRGPSPSISTAGGGLRTSAGKGVPRQGKGLWDGNWTSSWASVQEFASSLLSGETGFDNEVDKPSEGRQGSRNGSRARRSLHSLDRESSGKPSKANWGPKPPSKSPSRPRLEDLAAGTLAEREAALRARRTASVLESHEGVNGGLDVAGRFKRISSDEDLRGSSAESRLGQEDEENMVYIHHVQSSDTYAGIVLKYRCREDAFRKANGLWSRDNIQIRKVLMIPVDACEIKGRPCDPPPGHQPPRQKHPTIDLLGFTAPHPTPAARNGRTGDVASHSNDHFSPSSLNGEAGGEHQEEFKSEEDENPWTHVRWVTLNHFPGPVEIARVSRRNMGYFPPRRKKSSHAVSSAHSTPRGSLDLLSPKGPMDSPGGASPMSRSRGHSLLSDSTRSHVSNHSHSASASTTSRGRAGSAGAEEMASRPAWMRRPGGVGSLGRHARAPGPEKDYFNTFARRHFPGINIDSLPSMSVMGSETARFGFASTSGVPDPSASSVGVSGVGIVESPFEEGRDVSSSASLSASSRQGSGLDKAAAAVETWLRGAFAKRPGTPVLGPHGGAFGHGGRHGHGNQTQDFFFYGDLIELTDTHSEDGRGDGGGGGRGDGAGAINPNKQGLLNPLGLGSSSRSDGPSSSTLRGRVRAGSTGAGNVTKGKKSD